MPRLAVEANQSCSLLFQNGRRTNDDRGPSHALRVPGGKGECVRSTSARADHVNEVQPQVIEKVHGVGGDHTDSPALQPCRSPIAGSIGNDHANPDAIVGLLVRMS
jgi:hypothetical protein